MDVIRITADSSRADIEQAIATLKAKHDRMPAHWEARRAEVMTEVEGLVDQWLAAPA